MADDVEFAKWASPMVDQPWIGASSVELKKIIISINYYNREKIEDYLRFLTPAGETRFLIFAYGSLGMFVNFMRLMLTLTLKIV